PRRVIAEAVVVEARGPVAFLAGVAVLLARDTHRVARDECGAAVRKELLVRQQLADLVELERDRALMRCQLVANARARCVWRLAPGRIRGPAMDDCNAAGAVLDVDRPAFEDDAVAT